MKAMAPGVARTIPRGKKGAITLVPPFRPLARLGALVEDLEVAHPDFTARR
jgi:hypothetical protein